MKFKNTEVWGFKHALRGMRNPMNSWDKSDTEFSEAIDNIEYYPSPGVILTMTTNPLKIGENDMKLCKKLIAGGTEHRKFLRQIFVSVDITAPLFWWKEFDTYKVGTVANSTSTMHKLATTPITLDCFEIDDLNEDIGIVSATHYDVKQLTESLILSLEELRKQYLTTQDKRYWKELIRWLPEGWLQTRTVTLNYENLLTIYRQRKNHKLNEWSGKDNNKLENFIGWMLDLPYMKEFIDAVESK